METTNDQKTRPESRGAHLEAARIRMELAGAASGKASAEAMMALQHAQNLVARRDEAVDEMRQAELNMQRVIEGGEHQPKPGTAEAPIARVVSAETVKTEDRQDTGDAFGDDVLGLRQAV